MILGRVVFGREDDGCWKPGNGRWTQGWKAWKYLNEAIWKTIKRVAMAWEVIVCLPRESSVETIDLKEEEMACLQEDIDQTESASRRFDPEPRSLREVRRDQNVIA